MTNDYGIDEKKFDEMFNRVRSMEDVNGLDTRV